MKNNNDLQKSWKNDDYSERRKAYEAVVVNIGKERLMVNEGLDSNKVWELVVKLPSPWKDYLEDEILYNITFIVGLEPRERKYNWESLDWQKMKGKINEIINP